MLEDLETLLQVELLVHDTATVDLHPIEGEIFLRLREKSSGRRRLGKVEERKEGEKYGKGAFDNEEVSPVYNRARANLKNPECKEA